MDLEEQSEEVVEEAMTSAAEERVLAERGRLQKKVMTRVDSFLGEGEKVDAVVIQPRYYGELLTWAIHHHIKAEGWRVVKTLGYQRPKPVYIDVSTGPGQCQNLLRDGLLFLARRKERLLVIMDINMKVYNSMVVTGHAHMKDRVYKFAEEVASVIKEQNFYRGGMLLYGYRLHFLKLAPTRWEGIILDSAIKDEIWANTIGFLARRECLARYGIPAKRGIILAGQPGTGKTLLCKALVNEASGITCIVASGYNLCDSEQVKELYEVAEDLAPCMVVIEDIDLIGQDRIEMGYSRASALLSLLSVLDGVEESREIVTVATTNHLEILDKAIIERPSRFDRIIELAPPALEQRRELISTLCRKIPLDKQVQAYVARRTDRYTPAQLQEVIYSLVIRHAQNNGNRETGCLRFTTGEVDSAVSMIGRKNKHHMGFITPYIHGSQYTGVIDIEEAGHEDAG